MAGIEHNDDTDDEIDAGDTSEEEEEINNQKSTINEEAWMKVTKVGKTKPAIKSTNMDSHVTFQMGMMTSASIDVSYQNITSIVQQGACTKATTSRFISRII